MGRFVPFKSNCMRYYFWAAMALFLLHRPLCAQHSERDYQLLIQQVLGGQMEVEVDNGRIDLLTNTYAIEIEFANKWKNAIGQALWYGLQKDKIPGIVIIKRDAAADNKHVIRLGSALQYAGLENRVKVWVYPDDFPAVSMPLPVAAPTYGAPADPAMTHWLTTNSKKRHNKTCQHYQKSNGRQCLPNEGTAAGCCGG